jgi:uncharacterized protein YdaU (DUF1376 family)
MHYYQFNIGDYHTHTDHLSEMEDLAYRRMLDWCYLHEKPLPEDVAEVARLIRMRSHSDSIANVLREFFELIDKKDNITLQHVDVSPFCKITDSLLANSLVIKVFDLH